jgi:enhancing lycopene biosynthesis protein 2
MDMHGTGKPVGFLCIAPAMAAQIYGKAGVKGVKLTIGKDQGTADAIRAMGAEHVNCDAGDCVVDADHKVVTTPAYMLAQGISEAALGIDKAVDSVLKMVK